MSASIEARAQLRIRHPASGVYAAFVDPAQMTHFWFPRCSGPLEVGGTCYWHVFADRDEPEIEVRVVALDPGRRIHIEWGGDDEFTTVEWRFIRESAKATFVYVTESGYTGSNEDRVARALESTGGFNLVLAAAKAWLEHGVSLRIVEDHFPA